MFRLYHRNSRFGSPEWRKLDRNMRVRLFHLAVALDRRTKQPRKHGGVIGRLGIEVLRQLMFAFLNMKTGACFPSHEQIAETAGCCVETVRKAIRALEAAGIITTVRRKVVASFTSRLHCARFECAVQDSNAYLFNVPLPDRATEGDLEKPLLRPRKEADASKRHETNHNLKNKRIAAETTASPDDPATLAAKKAHWIALLGTDGGR